MKYGFLRGEKVAECQESQTQLMGRFLKNGTVDEWRDAEAKTPEKADGKKDGGKTTTPPAPDTKAPDAPAPQENGGAVTPPAATAETIPDFNGGEGSDGKKEEKTDEQKAKRGKRGN